MSDAAVVGFGYVDGVVVESIAAPDGKRQVDIVRRLDGTCLFAEQVFSHDEYSGDFWEPGAQSGLFADVGAAKAEAVATLPWLRWVKESK